MSYPDVRMEDAVDDPEGMLCEITVLISYTTQCVISDDCNCEEVMDALRDEFGNIFDDFDEIDILEVKEI